MNKIQVGSHIGTYRIFDPEVSLIMVNTITGQDLGTLFVSAFLTFIIDPNRKLFRYLE